MNATCLYSFDIYIEKVVDLKVSCQEAAVAFRLLDYPTVIIYQETLSHAENNQERCRMSEGSFQNFKFNKGKSCLFKLAYSELESMLQKAPLYLMLLDCSNEKPNLVGTCSIPLLSLLCQISNQSEQNNYESPSFGVEKNVYKLYNLMSSRVGKIGLRLKLTCFGKSLLKHMSISDKKELKSDLQLGIEISCRDKVDRVLVPPTVTLHEKNDVEVYDKSVQVANQKLKKKKKLCKQRREEEACSHFYRHVEDDNIICPPPLFMNLCIDQEVNDSKDIKSTDVLLTYNDMLESNYPDYDVLSSDEEPVVEILPSDRIKINNHSVHKNNAIKSLKPNTSSEILNNPGSSDLANMPILCSLLKEIQSFLHKEEKHVTCFTDKPIPLKSEDTTSLVNKYNFDDKENRADKCLDSDKKQIDKDRFKKKQSVNYSGQRKINHSNKNIKKLQYGQTKTQKLRYSITHPENFQRTNGPNGIKIVPVKKGKHVNILENEKLEKKNLDFTNDSKEIENELASRKNIEIDSTNENLTRQRYNSLSVTIPSFNQEEKEEGFDDLSSRVSVTENKDRNMVGFYSPKELSKIDNNVLGKFNDEKPWSSVEKYEDSFESETESDGSAIPVTSSISLPLVSERTLTPNGENRDQESNIGNKYSPAMRNSDESPYASSIHNANRTSDVSRASRVNSRMLSLTSNQSPVSSSSSRNKTPVHSLHSPVKAQRYFAQKKKNSRENSLTLATTGSLNSVNS